MREGVSSVESDWRSVVVDVEGVYEEKLQGQEKRGLKVKLEQERES